MGALSFYKIGNIFCCIAVSVLMSACAPALLQQGQRAAPEQALLERAERHILAQDLDGAPINSTELILSLYRSHLRLRDRVPLSITSKGFRTLGVRRSGVPQRGDLLIFEELPNTLDVAVILEVRGAQAVRAIGVLRGAPRELLLHLAQKDIRRVNGALINSYVRRATTSSEGTLSQGGYLAGELLVDVRALF